MTFDQPNSVTLPPSTVTPSHSAKLSLGSSLIFNLLCLLYPLLSVSSLPPMANQHLSTYVLSLASMSSSLTASRVVLQAHTRAGRPLKSAKGTMLDHTSSEAAERRRESSTR
eukprot:CAMPEP_0182455050 /NCGR_PEP_ID=MMETSP1319-20130603/1396_1 /TAXON_ID=172717 /ORGANISM="Bolidomonas pacifica, Strain RCC208" /LENGTH=111 /DNA_ID=CAMNT_0024653081 /DNA_START=191 /DNA_END=526 /DNA_ORIENTATION=-